MDYTVTRGDPMTEDEALATVAEMGLHGIVFDDVCDVDETLHWHEFDVVTFVISGSGSFADEHGTITTTGPGCSVQASAGWLHRTLAGTNARTVLGTNLPREAWTKPIDKEPADRATTSVRR